jgi:hypothetical protein
MMRRELAGPPVSFLRRGAGADSSVLQIPTTTIYGSDVDAKLQAMVSDLTTNGCQQTDTPSVRAFQVAFNAQSTPNGGTTLVVDGLYGANTQAAASSVNTNDQLSLTIPDGCVGKATFLPDYSTSSSNVSVTTASPYTPYIVAGAVVATGLASYAIWHHHTHGGRRRAMVHHHGHR